MAQKSYCKVFEVYLGDTSAYGNAYYMSYHRWVAFTKEDFFIENVIEFSDLFKRDGIKLFVLRSSLKVLGECKLHEKIKVEIVCRILKKIKAELFFRCYNLSNNKIIAESENTVVFVDKNNNFIMIPDVVRQSLMLIRE